MANATGGGGGPDANAPFDALTLQLSAAVLLLVACNLPPSRGKWKEIHDNVKTAAASLFVAILVFGATWSLAAVVTIFPEIVSDNVQYAFVASFSLQVRKRPPILLKWGARSLPASFHARCVSCRSAAMTRAAVTGSASCRSSAAAVGGRLSLVAGIATRDDGMKGGGGGGGEERESRWSSG